MKLTITLYVLLYQINKHYGYVDLNYSNTRTTKSKKTENSKWYEQAVTLMNLCWTMKARNIKGDQNGEVQCA